MVFVFAMHRAVNLSMLPDCKRLRQPEKLTTNRIAGEDRFIAFECASLSESIRMYNAQHEKPISRELTKANRV